MQQLHLWITRNTNPSWIPIVSLQLSPQNTFFFFLQAKFILQRGKKRTDWQSFPKQPPHGSPLLQKRMSRKSKSSLQSLQQSPALPGRKYRACYCTVNRELQPQRFFITDSQTMMQKPFQQQRQVENRAPVSVHAKTLIWSVGTPASASTVPPGRTTCCTTQRLPATRPHSSMPGRFRPISESPALAQNGQPSPERSRKGAPPAIRE